MERRSFFAEAIVSLSLVTSACHAAPEAGPVVPGPDHRLAEDARVAILEAWVQAAAKRAHAHVEGDPQSVGLMDSRPPSAGGPGRAWIEGLIAEGVIADFCAAKSACDCQRRRSRPEPITYLGPVEPQLWAADTVVLSGLHASLYRGEGRESEVPHTWLLVEDLRRTVMVRNAQEWHEIVELPLGLPPQPVFAAHSSCK